ncbi:hypothetical protein [Streptomyces sp. Rer75]|uniref:hypothetical protein n=1 Tax=Streptomyces sp. Rer75 TaxID=2750011 RepID=UPI0015CFA483|nr:hypothetical protein [Streptomyces sp. Rer75]QLH19277.1 hypothetical protein HYQ63_00005 [Streptomyces sp. Rer75]
MPWALASKSQLGRADLPREPGGPVRGWVTGRDFRGREMDIELYAVAESVPTKASGGQLAAADRRRTATVRACKALQAALGGRRRITWTADTSSP